MAEFIFSDEDLVFNYQRLQKQAERARIIAVVKSDGYGLGLLRESMSLVRSGCRMLAVSCLEEARLLREAGILTDILLLSPVYDPRALEELVCRRITCSVTSVESALELEVAAQRVGKSACAHLVLDTGFGRHGFAAHSRGEILQAARLFGRVTITGIYSHLASAARRMDRHSYTQWERFSEACDTLRIAGVETGLRHLCNSAAFFAYPEMHMDAVRLGSALLGRGRGAKDAGLRCVGELRGIVEDVYERPRGSYIGYGSAVRLPRDTRIAVVSIGYRDGFGLSAACGVRSMFSPMARRPTVRIADRECRVVGRIGCCSSMVDVSSLPCRPGDPVFARVNPLLVRKASTNRLQ